MLKKSSSRAIAVEVQAYAASDWSVELPVSRSTESPTDLTVTTAVVAAAAEVSGEDEVEAAAQKYFVANSAALVASE